MASSNNDRKSNLPSCAVPASVPSPSYCFCNLCRLHIFLQEVLLGDISSLLLRRTCIVADDELHPMGTCATEIANVWSKKKRKELEVEGSYYSADPGVALVSPFLFVQKISRTTTYFDIHRELHQIRISCRWQFWPPS
jgi:hypothetical protein